MKLWSYQQAVLRSGLKATTKHLLLTLSTYMNQHGEGCYPSVARLIEDTSLSRRSIHEHLNIACEAGYLTRHKRNMKGQEWASNEYRAAVPDDAYAPSDAADAPDNQGVQEAHPLEEKDGLRGAADAHEGCISRTQGVQEVHTTYPVNYPKELSNTTPLPPGKPNMGGGGSEFGKKSAAIQEIISAPFPLSTSIVHSWLASGAEWDADILPTIATVCAQQRSSNPHWCPSNLKYFTRSVLQAVADRKAEHTLPPPNAKRVDLTNQKNTTKGALDAIFGSEDEA